MRVRALPYWRRVLKRSFAETLGILRLEFSGFAMIAILIAAIYVLLVWHFVGKDEANLEATRRLLGWLSPLLIFPAVFLPKLFLVPAEMDAEASERNAALAYRLKPKMRLELPEQDGVKITRKVDSHVYETVSGRRGINRMASEDTVLRLLCRNESDVQIEECETQLISAFAVRHDGGLEPTDLLEPVSLSWSRDFAKPEYTTALPAGQPKSVFVLARRSWPGLYLYRPYNDLPREYAMLFQDGKRYRLVVRASARDCPASDIVIDVWPEGTPGERKGPPWILHAETVAVHPISS